MSDDVKSLYVIAPQAAARHARPPRLTHDRMEEHVPETDYTALATRAAANVIAEAGVSVPVDSLELLTSLVAVAWLNGYGAGTTATMAEAEQAFRNLAADLAAAIPA